MGSVTLEAGLDWAPRGRPVTVDGVLTFVPPDGPTVRPGSLLD